MIREDLRSAPYVGVISGWRASNVAKMEELVGPVTWYVPEGQVEDYRAQGAASVKVGGGLCESRNALLDDAFAEGSPCIQLSDDLRKIQKAVEVDGKKKAVDISFEESVALIVDGLRSGVAKLAGVAPTANPFYWNPKKPVHPRAFIVGDYIYVKPSKPRFDTDLKLKEDYDFTLQHIAAHGMVARRNDVLVTFLHRNNEGGAVSYRTSEMEKATIQQLRKRWGGHIQDNPRRPDEILLKL